MKKTPHTPDETPPRKLTDVPQWKDRPPVAPARVAVLKANYKQAWLWFLFMLCMIIAWGIPARYFFTRYFRFKPVATELRDADVFVALAYEGISASPREVAPERFREHVHELRKAGYAPITLRDIHAFYAEGALLPRNAVLMTFDHGRKSSYFDARKVLARGGWPAVVFLWTKPIQDEDPASLRWPYIRSMLRSGAWEVGAQSHLGFDQIVADSDGTRRNYLTAPQWIPHEMRYENPEDWSARIRADHEYVRQLIVRETGVSPRAFAFPYGDFGQYDPRATLSRRLNLGMVGTFYDLGFVHGYSALNTRYSDPRRLHRLLVRPEWTGRDLVAHLERAWPLRRGISTDDAMRSPHVWLTDWGSLERRDDGIRLQALPETTGATAWMNGSDLFRDVAARFVFHIEKGQVGLYFRASPDGERHLHLGIGEGGEVWLRQKHAGLPPFTLGSGHYTPDETGRVEVNVQLRDSLILVEINNRPVFQEIVSVRGKTAPGMMGIGIWDPERGRAGADFRSTEIYPLDPSVLTWIPTGARDSGLSSWMNRHAVRHTHLAPPWLRISPGAQSLQPGWDARLYRYFAATYHMKWTPEIVVEHMDTHDTGLPKRLANLAADLEVDGIYCNLSQLRDTPSLSRITAWIHDLYFALKAHELDLLIRLPPAWERESTLAALAQALPQMRIVCGDETYQLFLDDAHKWSTHLVRAAFIDVSDVAAPRLYTLTGGDAPYEDWQTEIRGHVLRQEGFDAFGKGDFERALDIWKRWSELEAFSEEPWRLIGDVHLRRGHHGRAVEYYRASLDRNPGQIPLVTHTARLLDRRKEKTREALELLTLYGRLFPGNTEILLAQADILMRQNRRQEAAHLVHRVVDENPDDLNALAMLHGLLGSPEERARNLETMLDIAARPGMSPHFVEIIRANNLLAWPESWMLMAFIEDRAEEEKASGTPGAYSQFVPRQTVVREAFSVRRMSDNWITVSDTEQVEGEPYVLAASPTAAEATLRLTNTDTLHSGFIEASIEDARGHFWLYARRGEGNMIRFGFEDTQRLYLQVWQHGRVYSQQSRVWNRTPEGAKLKLVVRGNAAFGFVNDEPAFGAPARVPPDLGLGWWGISPWAAEFGVAEVVIRDLSGGPEPVTIALFRPRTEEWSDQEAVAALTPHALNLHAVAPLWFTHDGDGSVRADNREDYRNLRILTRFYQIRLMPAIRAVTTRMLDVEDLIALAEEENVDGFTLLFARMPGEEWFKEAERALIGSNVSLLAARVGEDDTIQLRELCPRVGLFSGRRTNRTLPLVGIPSDTQEKTPMPRPETPPPSGTEMWPEIHRALYF